MELNCLSYDVTIDSFHRYCCLFQLTFTFVLLNVFQEKCAADMERLQRELERTQAQLQSNRTQLQQAEQAQEKARADVLDKQLEMEGLQVRG